MLKARKKYVRSSLHVEWLVNPRVHDLCEKEENDIRINESDNIVELLIFLFMAK